VLIHVVCVVRRVKSVLDATSGKVVVGGQTDEETKYISPTLLADVELSDSVMKQEVCHYVTLFTVQLCTVTFPPLPHSKLVLYLTTQKGWKAELTWVVPKIVYPLKTVIYLRYNQTVSYLGSEPVTESHKSNVLTTTPPIGHFYKLYKQRS